MERSNIVPPIPEGWVLLHDGEFVRVEGDVEIQTQPVDHELPF